MKFAKTMFVINLCAIALWLIFFFSTLGANSTHSMADLAIAVHMFVSGSVLSVLTIILVIISLIASKSKKGIDSLSEKAINSLSIKLGASIVVLFMCILIFIKMLFH